MDDTFSLNETWVIIAPVSVSYLDQLLISLFGEDYKEEYHYVLLEGKKNYSAIACNDFGSIGSERYIASKLSEKLESEVYVLLFEDEPIKDNIITYQHGVITGSRYYNEWSVAEEYLGFALPGTPQESERPKIAAVVIEGVWEIKIDPLIHIFESAAGVVVKPVAIGLAIYHKTKKVEFFGSDLSEQFPDHTVFVVLLFNDGDFMCDIEKKGKITGSFFYPFKKSSYFPILETIHGHTTPDSIMNYLGVTEGNGY